MAVHGRDPAALTAVHAEIEKLGGRAIQAIADVTSFAAIEAMRERIEKELGPIDILVANAGGSPIPPGLIEDISESDWRASVDANLTATFLTVKSVLPGMKQRRSGNIVTVSSAAGHRPHVRSPVAYAAAKAGIELFTKDLALQAGPFGIRANCLAPETILTERNLQQIPEGIRQQLVEAHPIRRLGIPDDVAGAALFLVTEESGWITGTVIDISGGS